MVRSTGEDYELSPDPDDLLESPFTLADLKATHEAVLGQRLQRDTFRRRMSLQLTAAVRDGAQLTRVDGGRPARLWNGPKTRITDQVIQRLSLTRA